MTEKQWLIQAQSSFFDSAIHSGNLQQLADSGYTALGNPICIANANGEIIANSSGGNIVDDPLWTNHVVNGFISKSVKLETERIFASDISGKPIVWERPQGPYRMMIYYPRRHNQVSLRIVMLEAFRPFCDIDFQTFEIFSKVVCFLLKDSAITKNFESNTEEYFLYKLLFEKKLNSKQNVESLLEHLNVSKTDNFVFFLTEYTFGKHAPVKFVTIKDELKDIFPRCTILQNKEQIICFIVMSVKVELTLLQETSLDFFLKKNQLQGCIGCTFDKIEDINLYYEQTKNYFCLGKQYRKGIRLYNAQKLTILKLIESLPKKVLDGFCYMPVFELFEIDKNNGTEYIITLYAFILSMGKISKTAKILGVHYNTAKKRLDYIQEILDINLNASYFSLMISIEALSIRYPESLKKFSDVEIV